MAARPRYGQASSTSGNGSASEPAGLRQALAHALALRAQSQQPIVTRLIDEERLEHSRHKRFNIHTIDAEAALGRLGVSSKVNADPAFLEWLFELGREPCGRFLEAHLDKIGVSSSTDIREKFL